MFKDENGTDWYVVHNSDTNWKIEYIRYKVNSQGKISHPVPVPADHDPDILPERLFEIE